MILMGTNYVSPSIYEHVADATTHDDAIQILEKLCVKPRNEVYNRHILDAIQIQKTR